MSFPDLSLESWRGTRDALHGYAQVLGAVQTALAPPLPHWWHIALPASAAGLRTPPLTAGGLTFDLELDLLAHRMRARTGSGERLDIDLAGQPQAVLAEELLSFLESRGALVDVDRGELAGAEGVEYDHDATRRYAAALHAVDATLKRLRSELGGRTSPVHLWSHHFDLAFTWFSGRLVPGVDPKDLESAEEQVGFGFSTGDEGFPDPYLYVTAYPFPEGLESDPAPGAGRWYTEPFRGAMLPLTAGLAEVQLLDYLRAAWRSAAARMS